MIGQNAARDRVERILSRELDEGLGALKPVAAVDRDQAEKRWYVRLEGQDRDFITIWFTLGDLTLKHETAFMPPSPGRREELFRYLLSLNRKLVGVQFAIGSEDEVFLVGALALDHVSADALDWIIGTVYATAETHWRTAMRIGFGSKFGG